MWLIQGKIKPLDIDSEFREEFNNYIFGAVNKEIITIVMIIIIIITIIIMMMIIIIITIIIIIITMLSRTCLAPSQFVLGAP